MVGELIGEGAAQEQTVVGETPNLAARLQGVAEPGQVVITETTRQLVGAAFELTPLAAQSLKGLSVPVTPFAVLGERAAGSRFEASAAALPSCRWSAATRSWRCCSSAGVRPRAARARACCWSARPASASRGSPAALLDAVRAEPHVRVRFQCSPYHADSAFWPVIQQLTRAAGLADQDTVEQRLDKLEAVLARAGDTTAAPLLADLLGLDGTGPLRRARADARRRSARARCRR